MSYEQHKADFTRWVQEHLGLASTIAATTGAVLLYYLTKSRPAITFPVSVDDQSVEIEPNVRASQFATDGKLVEYYYDDAKTCHEAFVRGMKVSKNGPCLGMRTGPNKEYEWLSYGDVYDQAHAFGSACVGKGLKAQNDTFVGIFAGNISEWVITEQACNMYSMVVVPLYDTLGPDACVYIINQTEMRIVVCDKVEKARTILQSSAQCPTLKIVVVVEPITDQLREMAKKAHIDLASFQDMVEDGLHKKQPLVPPRPDDICTICYTSGTTGDPKGVMLSHKNLIANTASVLVQVPGFLSERDTHVSYLPLAHMFERILQSMMFQHGARVGFFRGDVKLLLEDLQVLQPTIFPTVPRLLNRIYDKVMMGIQGSAIKTFLFNQAMRSKQKLLKQGISSNDTIWDKLVFKKIQAGLGGKVRIVVTGSAPLAENVLNFARCALGCKVFEGYGQTECTAGLSFTLSNEYRTGNVGAPLPCNLVKLIDVPEMEYYARNNKGEVCCKGTNVMSGYYKDPVKTAEAVDSEGWLHTGDIGQWLPSGALKIIDRRKHIFKLAQGEYLAPERIEGIYVRCSLVAQVFVDGSPLESFAVAVMVPDPDVLPKWAQQNGMGDQSMEAWCRSDALKKEILADITKIGKEAGLKSFEQAKDIHLHPDLFSVENGLLTPTFKSKRPVLRKYFESQVQAMYAKAK